MGFRFFVWNFTSCHHPSCHLRSKVTILWTLKSPIQNPALFFLYLSPLLRYRPTCIWTCTIEYSVNTCIFASATSLTIVKTPGIQPTCHVPFSSVGRAHRPSPWATEARFFNFPSNFELNWHLMGAFMIEYRDILQSHLLCTCNAHSTVLP